MRKNRIIFILHLPPPIHGAAMMGKIIKDSKIINKSFDNDYINLTLANDLTDIGNASIRKLHKFIKQLLYIYKNVKKTKPDLCYVTPNSKGAAFYKDFLVIMILKLLNQNIVIHYHNKGVSNNQNKIVDNFLYKIFFKNLKVIILSKELYSDINKYVNIKDVYICPNGIPTEKEKAITRVHHIFNILFLSNMMQSKGVWDLLEACFILKQKGKHFNCHFVGKWSDISEIEFNKKVDEYQLKDFVFAHGAKYNDEKNVFFENADCFVLPTHNECFPLVLLEAMRKSIACIASNEGGIKSIIDENKTGFIIEKKSPKVLAEKIDFLIEHPIVCKEMGKAGRNKFESQFTVEKFENTLKDILHNIINKV